MSQFSSNLIPLEAWEDLLRLRLDLDPLLADQSSFKFDALGSPVAETAAPNEPAQSYFSFTQALPAGNEIDTGFAAHESASPISLLSDEALLVANQGIFANATTVPAAPGSVAGFGSAPAAEPFTVANASGGGDYAKPATQFSNVDPHSESNTFVAFQFAANGSSETQTAAVMSNASVGLSSNFAVLPHDVVVMPSSDSGGFDANAHDQTGFANQHLATTLTADTNLLFASVAEGNSNQGAVLHNHGDLPSEPEKFGATDAVAAEPIAAAPSDVWSYAQMADYLLNGFWTWAGGAAHHFATTTVSYNIQGLTAAGQNLAQLALAAWHDVTNLNFVQTTGSALITFDDNQPGAFTSYTASGSTTTSTFVNVSTAWLATYGTGMDSYSYQTYIHEIGHTLGLGHAGPYNGSATYGIDNNHANDTWQFSVMSYFSQPNYGGASYRFTMTPMMADILAVDSVYGAATTTHLGDTVYGFNSNAGAVYNFGSYSQAPAYTIYDSAGNDTLDCSGYGATQLIDLRAGNFSNIGGLVGNIGIALNATIENAIGGSGNDTIIGNDFNNVLNGGNGGADYLIGGLGSDTVSYANTSRAVIIDLTAQLTWDGLVNDTLSSIENAIGSAFNDTIWGDAGDNVLDGGAGGADSINGAGGNDTVSYASSLRPVIIDLAVQKTWDGLVNDTLSSIENATGSAFNDTFFGSTGDNIFNGGAGADTFLGNGGNDTFVFNRGEGNGDTIQDFDGNGAAVGDQLRFVGYGTAAQGATFTQVDATHWSINSADGTVHDVITLANGASVHASDYVFV